MSNNVVFHFVRHAPVIRKPHDLIYDSEIEVDLSCTELFQKAASILPSPKEACWVSSWFPRAGITASKILVEKGISDINIETVDGFEERRFGVFTGKTKSSLKGDPTYEAYVNDPINAVIPEGESGVQFFARVTSTIDKHAQTTIKKGFTETVVACHGGTIRAASFYHTGLPEDSSEWPKKKIPFVSVHQMSFKVD